MAIYFIIIINKVIAVIAVIIDSLVQSNLNINCIIALDIIMKIIIMVIATRIVNYMGAITRNYNIVVIMVAFNVLA